MEMLAARRGRWFEPRLVDEVRTWAGDAEWWGLMDEPEADAVLLDTEPQGHVRAVGEDGLDRISEAFAEIIDAKSPFTSRHSRGVADYAVAIAEQLGLPDRDRRQLYRAGLLHDIGKLGISSRILDKPAALTPSERTQIQRHPAFGWAILKRVRAFRSFAWSAVLHHERLDGAGYPWGVPGEELDVTTRIL
jgi:putative nucleotidyltransferase with HDIG domain